MKIGVVGCGQMGRPMAEALVAAGFQTRGLDILEPSSFGAFAPWMTDRPADMADRDTVISVVRDMPQTEAVLFDAGLAAAPNLRRLVISSTVSPKYVRALAGRLPKHVALVDAPMSGAPIAAQERRLSFMLGGAPETLAKLEPVFRAMGTTIHAIGPLGAGMTAKVLNNLIAASSVTATRLALDWGAELGLDLTALREVFHTSSGQTWFGTHFDDIAFAREGYDATNTMGILRKDIESALDAAPSDAQTALPEALIRAVQTLKPLA